MCATQDASEQSVTQMMHSKPSSETAESVALAFPRPCSRTGVQAAVPIDSSSSGSQAES